MIPLLRKESIEKYLFRGSCSFCAEGAGPSGTVLVPGSFCAEGVGPSGTVSSGFGDSGFGVNQRELINV